MKQNHISKLNNIDWEKITLYHGTTKKSWDMIIKSGFKIPKGETNWLGRGIYFGVNNIITPIKYAFQSYAKKIYQDDEPIIIEIKGNSLKHHCLDRILDLTTDIGLLYYFLISNEFRELARELSRDDPIIRKFNKNFHNSSLYSERVKNILSLDIDIYLFAKMYDHDYQTLRTASKLISTFQELSKANISNLIIDWYNYYVSGGSEEEIPIKGVMANFNTGDPILLNPHIPETSSPRSGVFYDYTSFLNRTEMAIFGFEYYRAYTSKDTWSLSDLFEGDKIQCEVYSREGGIKNKLMKIARDTNFPSLSEEMIINFANLFFETIKKLADQV